MRARTVRVVVGVLLAGVMLTVAGGSVSAAAPTGSEPVVCDQTQPDDDAAVSTDFSTETIESYDIDVVIDADGSATFKETIEYTFDGPHHGIFRDIIVRQQCTDEFDRVYPFELLSVDSPSGAPDQFTLEHPTPTVTNPLSLVNFMVDGSPITQVKIGDPDRTVTGTHTYVIAYRLDGVVNGLAEHDEFYWNVVGNGWSVTINNVDVTVRGPEPAVAATCFAGPTGSRSPCSAAEVVDGAAHYRQTVLPPHENLTVLSTFPVGAVTNAEPVLERRWSIERAVSPPVGVLGLAAVLLAVFVGGWTFLVYRVGRDHQLAGSHVDVAFAPVGSQGGPVPLFADDHSPVEFIPPDGIRPGQLGVLIDEVAHPVDVTGTLIDLAVRGYLRIEEVERKWRRDDFLITRLDKDTGELLAYEKLLLTELVASPGSSTKLSDLKNTFASSFQKVVDAMYDDVVSRGWFHGRPDKIRRTWKGIGWLVIIVSIVLGIVALLWTWVAILAVPLFVGGLLLLLGSRFMPRRTPAGTGLVRRVHGFEEFIRDSEAPRAQWAENKNIFSEYLPYAIVLRCADRWAKTFEDLGQEALGTTGWYHGHAFTPMYVSSSMSSFSSSASTTLTSSPASSGSGGGGSSGGGGGGGGGGSW